MGLASPLQLLLALAFGLVLEALVGEPRRFHPLVGFGLGVKFFEKRFNRKAGSWGIALGGFSVLALISIPLLVFLLITYIANTTFAQQPSVQTIALGMLHGTALWFALGARSLFSHVEAIALPLVQGDLAGARRALSMIVSRDCSQLDETAIAKGAIESNLENGADAIFSTLFWFLVFGGAGAIVHRLANTLDAMWGYRTPRFIYFGRVAARLDDVLNFIPARLTAFSYALLGETRLAHCAWREQARHWDSPNAGPVMAAGAGALGITLGGNAIYHGRVEQRIWLGFGPEPEAADIVRSLSLVKETLVLWAFSSAVILLLACCI
ncbi:adenosylcobinamide-phosphate synthase CbiB [Chitinibacter sp. SCUT-21]|uniref:adenosylcobinamide-phosphate synthase CbiB n=1 Tax=Chitinibacter sp. SCUT-21 TaxID=2970891 RepID=UPI0035A5CFAE